MSHAYLRLGAGIYGDGLLCLSGIGNFCGIQHFLSVRENQRNFVLSLSYDPFLEKIRRRKIFSQASTTSRVASHTSLFANDATTIKSNAAYPSHLSQDLSLRLRVTTHVTTSRACTEVATRVETLYCHIKKPKRVYGLQTCSQWNHKLWTS